MGAGPGVKKFVSQFAKKISAFQVSFQIGEKRLLRKRHLNISNLLHSEASKLIQ